MELNSIRVRTYIYVYNTYKQDEKDCMLPINVSFEIEKKMEKMYVCIKLYEAVFAISFVPKQIGFQSIAFVETECNVPRNTTRY